MGPGPWNIFYNNPGPKYWSIEPGLVSPGPNTEVLNRISLSRVQILKYWTMISISRVQILKYRTCRIGMFRAQILKYWTMISMSWAQILNKYWSKEPGLVYPGLKYWSIESRLVYPGPKYWSIEPGLVYPGPKYWSIEPGLVYPGLKYWSIEPGCVCLYSVVSKVARKYWIGCKTSKPSILCFAWKCLNA